MLIIKFLKKLTTNWFSLFAISLFLAGIVDFLYYSFQIIIPIFGSFIVQLVWLFIFFGSSVIQLFRSNHKKFDKVVIITIISVVVLSLQFFNLIGASSIGTSLPRNVSSCKDFPFYVREKPGSFDNPGLYMSNFPWLYFQKVGNYVTDTGETFKAEKYNFRSDLEFNKFVDCVNINYKYTVVCKEYYYSSNSESDKAYKC